jgi:hypothetical protein
VSVVLKVIARSVEKIKFFPEKWKAVHKNQWVVCIIDGPVDDPDMAHCPLYYETEKEAIRGIKILKEVQKILDHIADGFDRIGEICNKVTKKESDAIEEHVWQFLDAMGIIDEWCLVKTLKR